MSRRPANGPRTGMDYGDSHHFLLMVMDGLARNPFDAQREVVQAVTRLLVDAGEPAAVLNAEMGTGKTMMAISTDAGQRCGR